MYHCAIRRVADGVLFWFGKQRDAGESFVQQGIYTASDRGGGGEVIRQDHRHSL